MNRMFLDPQQPLSTCTKKDCAGCEVGGRVNCHFSMGQLVRFLALVMPAMILGIIGIVFFNWLFLLPWVGLFILYFGLVEIRVMCSHCSHYAEPELRSLKCWANYGSPKLWKYRPGPMSVGEKIVFFTGMFLVFAYPIPFFLIDSSLPFYILGGVYVLAVASFKVLLGRLYCSVCINFACPFNTVDGKTRENFRQINTNTWQLSR